MTTDDVVVRLTDERDSAAEAVIEGGLAKFNEKMAGYRDWRSLDVLIYDRESNSVLGGLLGRTSLGLFFVDLFFVPEDKRGCGIGNRVLERAEAEARLRGCSAVMLLTITFQASGFYERCGYQVLGRIECRPPGYTRLCMTKAL